jgi:dephospho-CoA kinase
VSKWAGKFVIGLTGNIGTGKSVVRRMLEHLGAYGIDADALSHRAIARGAPGYQKVIDLFGKYILGEKEEIDRTRLGRLVFADPTALNGLEAIVHPLVGQAVDYLIARSSQPVIVIEAIKLLESNLVEACDSIWTVYTPPNIQLNRLMKQRGMSVDDATQRIQAQPSQEKKIAAANVVIRNAGGYEDTWKQVVTAWRKFVPAVEEVSVLPAQRGSKGEMQVTRGRPKNSAEIAGLLNRLHRRNRSTITEDNIMEAFGEKAFLMLQVGEDLKGLVGWQVENLVSRTTDMVVDPAIPLNRAVPVMIKEMERASQDLQCEASLVFVTPDLARHEEIWRGLGYQPTKPESLEVMAWQDAARESMPDGTVLLFKKLRQDRVLRPI